MKKIGLLVLLLILLATATAVFADGGSECDQSPDCTLLDPAGNSGSYTDPAGRTIEFVVIKAGQNYPKFYPGTSSDGCYRVSIQGPTVRWAKIGTGNTCQDISHVQVWFGPPEPPPLVCDVEVGCDMAHLTLGPQHEDCTGWELIVWVNGVLVGQATTGTDCMVSFPVGAEDGDLINWEVWEPDDEDPDNDPQLIRWGSLVCQE